jgi:hypothetical protein
LGELKCPDLDFVYDMTWAEFQIRIFAYKRQDLYKWQMMRELMWVTYYSSHQDPKKIVKRKEQFLPLDGDRKVGGGVSEEAKDRFMKEFLKYKEKIQVNT